MRISDLSSDVCSSDLFHGYGLVSTNGAGSDPIIRIRALENRFGAQMVHHDLSLEMQRGEILGVVGGSGSGKSVLMRSILGLRRPQGGSIEALGHDVLAGSEADHRVIERRTGVLFQDGALFSSLNVAENVSVPLKENHPDLPAGLRDDLIELKVRLVGLPMEIGRAHV